MIVSLFLPSTPSLLRPYLCRPHFQGKQNCEHFSDSDRGKRPLTMLKPCQLRLMESQHKGLGDCWHQPSCKHNFCLLKTQTPAYKFCKVRQIHQQKAEVILMFVFCISDTFYFNLQLYYRCQHRRVLTVNRKDSDAPCLLKGCFCDVQLGQPCNK